jgi:hypothetical protein
MTLTERLDELERRLRMVTADALRRAAERDPTWRRFEASLQHCGGRPGADQNGISSFLSAPRRDEAGDAG